jgi:hypothetical protein
MWGKQNYNKIKMCQVLASSLTCVHALEISLQDLTKKYYKKLKQNKREIFEQNSSRILTNKYIDK